MGNVDELLDSMGPRELEALESELDKTSGEQASAYYFGLGVKKAREALAQLEKGGEMTPEMFLIKQSKGFENLPPKVKAKIEANKKNPPGEAGGPGHGSAKMSAEELDAALDKCSEEELTKIEAQIDAEAQDRDVKLKCSHYYNIGVELAKTAAARIRVPKPKAPKTKDPKPMGIGETASTFMKQHPGAAAAGLVGGGYLLGQSR